MGTRGIYGFYKNGIDKLTYNHYDSYHEGLGKNVVDFIKNTTIDEMNEVFEKIVLVSDVMPTKEQIEECSLYTNLNVSNQNTNDWYCLLRDAQGDLNVYKNGLKYMIDDKEFIKDSLFCEYGYIINLDENILEVYEGFQTSPQTNRYITDKPCDSGGKYFNCALVGKYKFDNLPEW